MLTRSLNEPRYPSRKTTPIVLLEGEQWDSAFQHELDLYARSLWKRACCVSSGKLRDRLRSVVISDLADGFGLCDAEIQILLPERTIDELVRELARREVAA